LIFFSYLFISYGVSTNLKISLKIKIMPQQRTQVSMPNKYVLKFYIPFGSFCLNRATDLGRHLFFFFGSGGGGRALSSLFA